MSAVTVRHSASPLDRMEWASGTDCKRYSARAFDLASDHSGLPTYTPRGLALELVQICADRIIAINTLEASRGR